MLFASIGKLGNRPKNSNRPSWIPPVSSFSGLSFKNGTFHKKLSTHFKDSHAKSQIKSNFLLSFFLQN